MGEIGPAMPQCAMLEYTAREWDLDPWAISTAGQADAILKRGDYYAASIVTACLAMYIREKLGKMAVEEWTEISGIAFLVAKGAER